MYKLLPAFLFAFLTTLSINAQVNIKGVLKSSFDNLGVGDTAIFTGAKEVGKDNQLHYLLKSTDDFLPADQIILLLDDINFWDVQQFYYVNYEIENNGWQVNTREKLEKKTLNLLAKLDSENKFYEDKFVEDYLQQLIQKIHYPKFSKGRPQYFNIKILNSDDKVCYAFDNGTIIISTQLIADSENERDLFRILAEAVGHILLNSNIEYVDENSESEYKQLGAIYPDTRRKRIQLIAEKYLNYYEKRTLSEPYASQIVFFNSVASVISYTAWQEYYSQHYDKSLQNIDKLVGYGIANSSDYLLNAKIYLKITHSAETNQKALEFLRKAAEFEDQPVPEIYSEMGVILIREKQYDQAKESFKKYHEMVVESKDVEAELWALKMINACDVFLKLSNTKFSPADSMDLMKIEIIDE